MILDYYNGHKVYTMKIVSICSSYTIGKFNYISLPHKWNTCACMSKYEIEANMHENGHLSKLTYQLNCLPVTNVLNTYLLFPLV